MQTKQIYIEKKKTSRKITTAIPVHKSLEDGSPCMEAHRPTKKRKKKRDRIRCTRQQQSARTAREKNRPNERNVCLPFANKKWRKMCARMRRRNDDNAGQFKDRWKAFFPIYLGYSHCIERTTICIVCTKFSRCCESHKENAKKWAEKKEEAKVGKTAGINKDRQFMSHLFLYGKIFSFISQCQFSSVGGSFHFFPAKLCTIALSHVFQIACTIFAIRLTRRLDWRKPTPTTRHLHLLYMALGIANGLFLLFPKRQMDGKNINANKSF